MMLIGLILIAVVIFLLFRRGNHPSFREEHESPMDVLKKRYASGEINREEFTEMKKNLNSN